MYCPLVYHGMCGGLCALCTAVSSDADRLVSASKVFWTATVSVISGLLDVSDISGFLCVCPTTRALSVFPWNWRAYSMLIAPERAAAKAFGFFYNKRWRLIYDRSPVRNPWSNTVDDSASPG